jgi:hypothetical protein
MAFDPRQAQPVPDAHAAELLGAVMYTAKLNGSDGDDPARAYHGQLEEFRCAIVEEFFAIERDDLSEFDDSGGIAVFDSVSLATPLRITLEWRVRPTVDRESTITPAEDIHFFYRGDE